MQNIEFKAELRNMDAAAAQCGALGGHHLGTLTQTDTYYKLTDGRLKKRESADDPVCWIYYHRPDRVRPRMCNYTILSDEQARRRWGTQSLHEWLTVRKTRDLWMIDHVRVHLDRVDDLGTFIEFEAIVSDRFDVKACHEAIAELRETFAPILGEPLGVSYCDLMEMKDEGVDAVEG
jgi:adenylate cyclase class IV